MIEVKLSNLVNHIEIIQKLTNARFKGKTAFQVARILKRIEEEIEIFNSTRMKLIEKYGEKDSNNELRIDENNNYIISNENKIKFGAEMNEILNSKIEINAEKISYDDLAVLELTPNEAIALEPFIEE